MPKAYSRDMRERVIAQVESGASQREAAEEFEVSASTAIIWVTRFRWSGDHDLPFGGDETAARLRAKLPNPDGSDDSQLPCGEPANDLAMPVWPKCAPRRCWLDGPWAAKYLKS
jgi:transposase-like protein